MDRDLKHIINLLKKIFPVLLENPNIMRGCDISDDEIDRIIERRELSLGVLQYVAGDRFFENFYNDININLKEAKILAAFLYKDSSYYIDDLKKEFPFIRE